MASWIRANEPLSLRRYFNVDSELGCRLGNSSSLVSITVVLEHMPFPQRRQLKHIVDLTSESDQVHWDAVQHE